MTTWSIQAVSRFWIRNGGDPRHVVNACAVALAESGNNDQAFSSAGDWGLWQINQSNFAAQGLNRITACDPDKNARVAVRMSGNGTNWAAWCTCWANPRDNCGHGFIAAPEVGSAAYRKLGQVQDALAGLVDENQAPPPANTPADVAGSWGYLQDFVGNYTRTVANRLAETNNAVRRLSP